MTAVVAYGCATFLDLTFRTISRDGRTSSRSTVVFLLFLAILALTTVVNIFSATCSR